MTQDQDPVIYLRSLPAIRERCNRVFGLAQEGKLEYFDWVPEKEQDVVEFCKNIIQVRRIQEFRTASADVRNDSRSEISDRITDRYV